jgi:hypothetical protein
MSGSNINKIIPVYNSRELDEALSRYPRLRDDRRSKYLNFSEDGQEVAIEKVGFDPINPIASENWYKLKPTPSV